MSNRPKDRNRRGPKDRRVSSKSPISQRWTKATPAEVMAEAIAELYGPIPDPEKAPETIGEKVLAALLGGRMTKAALNLITSPDCPFDLLQVVDRRHWHYLPVSTQVRLNYEISDPLDITVNEPVREKIMNPDYEEFMNWDEELGDITDVYPNYCPIKWIYIDPWEVYCKELTRGILREWPAQDWGKIIQIASAHGLIKDGYIYLENWEALKGTEGPKGINQTHSGGDHVPL